MTETEIWAKWESQVVNGLFPLRRFLGRSNHSVVFLTECRAHNLPNAAIKIIPEDPALAETQLARWREAAGLSHPHLMRLLDCGRCKLGGHPFLFVITEYAEQNLAQILPHRGLTSDEARELLNPTLDALAFLHDNGMVHGQLKPSNLLVVADQLKLSSDAIRPSGEPPASVAKPSAYDPPEIVNGVIGPAGDVWSLGATLMEALTQIPPGPHDGAEPRLPSLPRAFAEFVRRCLSNDPRSRPSLADLRSLLNPPPQSATPAIEIAAVVARPQPVEINNPPRAAARSKQSAPRWLMPAAAVGAAVLMVLWIGTRVVHRHASAQSAAAAQPTLQQPAPNVAQVPAAPAPKSAVLHEEIPAVSHGAVASIRGQIKVVVRVTVDRSGTVAAASLEARGSSRYFARLSTEAAKKWKFTPADTSSPREWIIQFEFAREGVSAHASARVKP